MRQRRGASYFDRVEGGPQPIVAEVKRRVHFSDADPMGIMWHGRYPLLFEEASEKLGRSCGLSYADYYEAGLRGPIVSLHVDYHRPLKLGEEFTVRASLVWCEGARLNTEFHIFGEDGSLSTSGYTVQLFTDGATEEPCFAIPELLERCRCRWLAGEFA